jgi:hypothetical protein
VQTGAVVSWLLRYVIEVSPGALNPDVLLKTFRLVLVNADQTAAPLSVAVAYLIRLSLRERTQISAELYVFIFEICRRCENNREKHVSGLFRDIVSRRQITIADLVNYPAALMQRYGKSPPLDLLRLFATGATLTRRFFKGWLLAHEKFPDLSNVYLRAVGQFLPRELLEQFPAADLQRNKDENQQLAFRNKKLFASSGRWLALLVVVAIGAALYR